MSQFLNWFWGNGSSGASGALEDLDCGLLNPEKKTPEELKCIMKESQKKLDEMAKIKERGSRMSDEEAVRIRKELDANNARLEATLLNIIQESGFDSFIKDRYNHDITTSFKAVKKYSGNIRDSEAKKAEELEKTSERIQKKEKQFYEMMVAEAEEEIEKMAKKCGCLGKK